LKQAFFIFVNIFKFGALPGTLFGLFSVYNMHTFFILGDILDRQYFASAMAIPTAELGKSCTAFCPAPGFSGMDHGCGAEHPAH
jgi:hypothetical protein